MMIGGHMEIYFIIIFGVIGIAAYTSHMLKVQKQVEQLNSRMDAQVIDMQRKTYEKQENANR